MQFDILTIFPEIIQQASRISLLGKAIDKGLLQVTPHNLRDYSNDKHRRVDDDPYGGGPGMVMQAPPIVEALEAITKPKLRTRKILLSPRGSVFNQQKALEYSQLDQLIFVCGRYEGVDERVLAYVDEELSVGDYVLSGGEFAALIVIDAVGRLLPGVMGDPESLREESHSQGQLEYPQYTRPSDFRGLSVPDVLLGGNHKAIERWREEQARELTARRRPDLLKD